MASAIITASSPHAADFIKPILKHIGEKDPQRITRQKIQENIVIHIQSNVCVRSVFIGFRTRNWVINRNWLCVLYALIVCSSILLQWLAKSHRGMEWNRDHRVPTFICCIHRKRTKLKCSSRVPLTITAFQMALQIILAPTK